MTIRADATCRCLTACKCFRHNSHRMTRIALTTKKFLVRRFFQTAALALALLASCVGQPSSVPSSRLAHLRKGVNITGWFAQASGSYDRNHLETFITSNDIRLIRQMGFDHVRLGVDPEQHLFHFDQADVISPEYLGYLDEAVRKIVDQGLAVIIELHAERKFKDRFASDDFVDRFADFWRALAQHFSALDPEKVFFEVLNEPEFPEKHRWYGIQARLLAAIREGAPRNTVILVGDHDDSIEGLLSLEPVRDPNVIYAFHYYEPYIFTHQGADWADNFSHYLKGVTYPSDPDSAKKAAAQVPPSDAVDRFHIVQYGMERWNGDRIEAEINQVAEWAARWSVPVICDEFGAYKKVAAGHDREEWFKDVRSALERHGIGWTVWDYSSDGFGVISRSDRQAKPDGASLHGLGLQFPK